MLTGYSAQVKVLTREGNQNAWSSVRIPDVHSSQGSEAKFLIISLVSKKGRATLVGNRSRVKAESKKYCFSWVVARQRSYSKPAHSSEAKGTTL